MYINLWATITLPKFSFLTRTLQPHSRINAGRNGIVSSNPRGRKQSTMIDNVSKYCVHTEHFHTPHFYFPILLHVFMIRVQLFIVYIQ